MPVALITSEIEQLVRSGAPVAIGVSGGKDSQAAALATFRKLDQLGHAGPRILVHADLGVVEWDDSLPLCEELARHLGVELLVVRRKAGGLMERWESRWASSILRYATLSTVTLVPCWSTPLLRFCTSELKTKVILPELKRRFPRQVVINVTGIRRAESASRSRATVASPEADGRVWNWRPIVDWSEAEVFADIACAGLRAHPAYTDFGMSRVSCRFCIMSSLPDLRAAAAQPEARELLLRMVDLEIASTFAFQGAHWLGDVAAQHLGPATLSRIATAKEKARRRAAAESRITKPMLYVKGWPTRMLTDEEADILASVRREVCQFVGIAPAFVDRDSIHHRYTELLAAKAARGGVASSETDFHHAAL
ncbi:phosphoadenosine phosphosulfate reductase family protein [Xanthobacter sp. DSM 14520]|uniref:phosphoadenosine phosphosulfate reductase domain-containing protein n=1 Tax=Xanthobacter autotrophicus (strain ATCC BAA-1158 / Py2) TaxID=78245 RepID=UPI003726BF88